MKDCEDSPVHHLHFLQHSLCSSFHWRSNRSRQQTFRICNSFYYLKLQYSSVTYVQRKFHCTACLLFMLNFFHIINFCRFHCPRKLFASKIFPDYGLNSLWSAFEQLQMVVVSTLWGKFTTVFYIYMGNPALPCLQGRGYLL